MTDLLSDVDAPSDAELISRVRGGDVAAYGDLFSRHKDAANRLARQLVRGPDSDDLVAEAFAKVLTVLQGGGGPDVAFRAYLLTAVRRLHVDRVRVGQRLQTTDDMTPFDPGVPFQDTAVAGFESGAAAKAFASLPERWQLVLWHLEVEGQKPADIAPLLGMSANSVSALAYRAREGLRQAFLTMHLSDISETDCRWVNEHLGAFVRKGLSKRDAGKVQGHLDECRRCTAMYLELTDVNSNLAGIIAPLLLGAAATGYLASTGAGLGVGGLLGLVSRAKDFAAANTGAVAAGAVATGVAVAAIATVVVTQLGGPEKQDVTADPARGITSSAPSVPGSGGPSSSRSSASSASPSSSAPTSTVSGSPSTTASGSPSESAGASATGSPTESPGLRAAADRPARHGATDGVTDGVTDGPTGGATDGPTDGTTDTPTDTPTTEPPAPGQPAVNALSVNDDGTSTSGSRTCRPATSLTSRWPPTRPPSARRCPASAPAAGCRSAARRSARAPAGSRARPRRLLRDAAAGLPAIHGRRRPHPHRQRERRPGRRAGAAVVPPRPHAVVRLRARQPGGDRAHPRRRRRPVRRHTMADLPPRVHGLATTSAPRPPSATSTVTAAPSATPAPR